MDQSDRYADLSLAQEGLISGGMNALRVPGFFSKPLAIQT